MVASIAVVGLVVVVIATVGHRGSSSSVVSPLPFGVPADARALVARMAVLRRPQSAADRLPASIIAQEAGSGGRLRIIPSLTRLAATVHAGPGPLATVQIFVVVGKSRGYRSDVATALEVAGQPGHRYLLYSATVVDTKTAAATGGLTPSAVSYNAGVRRKEWLDVGVVPDGVSRVKWVYPRPGEPPYRKKRGHPGLIVANPAAVRAGIAVYPTVENNVAVPKAGTLGGLMSATWYRPDGRVIASYNEIAAQRAAAEQALAASARQPIAPALIEHFAIFRQHIPPPTTIKQLPERTAILIAGQGYGLNVNHARFVPYPGTPGLWAVPGARGVSMAKLIGSGGGGGNVPVAIALADGMITTSCCAPTGKTVWGLVVDGNPTVTAVFADGTRKTVRVIDNVYSVTGRVTDIVAKDAAGRRITIKAPG
jgi:hypothetical protein